MEFKVLPNTPVYKALSEMGKKIFQPDGIFYWAGRSKNEADLNGTVGTAMGVENTFINGGRDKFVPFYLEGIKSFINIEPERFVSYAPLQGVEQLRKLWLDWIIYKGNVDSNLPSGSIDLTGKLSTPIICNGITNAIFLVSRFFLDPGEIIISPEKRWGNYDSIISRMNGIKIESFKFFNGQSYNTNGMMEVIEEVGKKQGKVVLLLNFPNNPTGYCPTQAEVIDIVEALKGYCEKTNGEIPVVLFCDDAYEGYVYTDERVRQSIFYELFDIHPAIIPLKLDGSSKEMLVYGARVAAITLGFHKSWYKDEEEKKQLNAEWENKLKALIRSTISNCSHFSQEVLVELLKKGIDKFLEERKPIINILKERYNKTILVFNNLKPPRLTMDPAGGGFFVFINVEGIPADKLADHLLKNHKLGTIPIVKPDLDINGLRVAFCSIPVEKIEDCIKRIDQGIRDLVE